MPRSRHHVPPFPALLAHRSAARVAPLATALVASLVASLAHVSIFASTAAAQPRAAPPGAAYETPLHLPANRFEFVVSGDTPPAAKQLAVHNGGKTRFTDVTLTRIAYADAARGAGWLVAVPRQTGVAPDELATVGTLCVDAAGLKAGTYRATAAVRAREVPDPVAISVTLVVTDAGARARRTPARCGTPATK